MYSVARLFIPLLGCLFLLCCGDKPLKDHGPGSDAADGNIRVPDTQWLPDDAGRDAPDLGLSPDARQDGAAKIDRGSAVDLTTADGDPCSNGQKDGDETDLDCGGRCAGCTAGRSCVVDGDCDSALCEGKVCRPPCSLWRYATSGRLDDATLNGGETRIYVAGSNGNAGYLLALDACGQLVKQSTHVASNMSELMFRAIKSHTGGSFWVGGHGRQTANASEQLYYGLFNASTLGESMGFTRNLGAGDDRIVAIDSATRIFMAGMRDASLTAAQEAQFAFSVDTGGGAPCEVDLGKGQGQGVVATADQVLFVGRDDDQYATAHRISARCGSVDCAAHCSSNWQARFKHGTRSSKGVAATVATFQGESYLYMSGFWNEHHPTEVDVGAFVVRVAFSDPKQQKSYLWNPTVRLDSFPAIVSDATGLYIAANREKTYDGPEGTALLKALSLDLAPRWETEIAPSTTLQDIELIGSDGLVVTGFTASGGMIIRCLRDGTCR